jgi:hypothetical protein
MSIEGARRLAIRGLGLCLALGLPTWSAADDPATPTQLVEKRQAEFDRVAGGAWRQVFHDPGTGDWRKQWFLDGRQAEVRNSPQGMTLTAGPEFKNDAHHMVLWTREQFAGDLKIEYEYTRLDSENRCVNILYIQATGSGQAPYVKDIAAWSQLRAVPAMRMYFDHMHTYHISYAAFPNDGQTLNDYVRARRYIPEAEGLRGTDLTPDYGQTGLFETGVPHRITVIKRGQELFMHVRNAEKQMLFHWENETLPPILQGRVGLRHMFTRSARYRDFRISLRNEDVPDGR